MTKRRRRRGRELTRSERIALVRDDADRYLDDLVRIAAIAWEWSDRFGAAYHADGTERARAVDALVHVDFDLIDAVRDYAAHRLVENGVRK